MGDVSTGRLSEPQREQFRRDGYCIVRGVWDPSRDFGPVREAYSNFIDAVAPGYLGDGSDELADFAERPLSQRLALLTAASRGRVFDHIDPMLQLHMRDYRRRRDLPSAQLPEIFALMRHPALLGLVEGLIGPEISASPVYHANMKLPESKTEPGHGLPGAQNQRADQQVLQDFYLGQTPLHRDTHSVLSGADDRIVVAWFPVTERAEEASRLVVVPGSHLDAERNETLALDVACGDLVFFDMRLQHGSTPNLSAQMRMSFNFRYLPTGARSGRPFVPGFVVRSPSDPERELRDPVLWADMWKAALDHLRWWDLPEGFGHTVSRLGTRAMSRRWEPVSSPQDWLALPAVRLDAWHRLLPAILTRLWWRRQ
jgi:hypothetical protein